VYREKAVASILASISDALVQSGSGITDPAPDSDMLYKETSLPSEPLPLTNERMREHQSRSKTETSNPFVVTKFECIKQSEGNKSELQIDN